MTGTEVAVERVAVTRGPGLGGRREWEAATREVTESELSGKPWEKLGESGVSATARTSVEGTSVRQAHVTSAEAAVGPTAKAGEAGNQGKTPASKCHPSAGTGADGTPEIQGQERDEAGTASRARIAEALDNRRRQREGERGQPEGRRLARAGDIRVPNKNDGNGA